MKKIRHYLFEFITIFVGITASFFVEEWRQDRENREQLEANLLSLKYELIKDTVNADGIINYYDSATQIYIDIFNGEFKEFKSVGDAANLFDNLIDVGVKFQTNAKTYEALIELNLSKYMRNDSILVELTDYYGYWNNLLIDYENRARRTLNLNNTKLQQNISSGDVSLAFLGQNEAEGKKLLAKVSVEFNDLIQDKEFRNANVSQIFFYNYLSRLFTRYKDKSKHLINLIDEELEEGN